MSCSAGRHVQKWLPSDLLARIDFIAFSVRLRHTISKNDRAQIFPALADLRLLWQPNALSNLLSTAAEIQV